MNRCLICYHPLEHGLYPYHEICSQKWFGTLHSPELSYTRSELTELAAQVVRSHVTVPGVQAKLSLHFEPLNRSESRFTLVGLWGNYILKPPVDAYPLMPEIEDLTMHLAALFSIPTVPHCLIPLQSGELAYLTKRIDRNADGSKIHMEDMCQLTGRLTENKYRGSYEQIGKTILKYSENPLFDIIRYVELILFSFLTGNADMHFKNFSLIYAPGNKIRLAPAYDLLATRLLIPESSDPEETALTLAGKKANLKASDFQAMAATLGLNDKQIENLWKRFDKALPDVPPMVMRSPMTESVKMDYLDLISHRAERLGMENFRNDSNKDHDL